MTAKNVLIPRAISIVLLLCCLLVMPVLAQEEVPSGPRYIVQSGDTLGKIAVRFNLTVAELTEANEISNPNQLFTGDVLELPNVDWIDGLLDVQKVPVGETFRSLRRRYHLEPQTLGRAAGIVSPIQVYAGYPVMIPTGIGEDLTAARAAVSGGESLLTVSARTGANPWAVAGANQLASQWGGLSGDVLLLPGTNQPGPGALPSPLTIDTSQGDFFQGRATVIRIGAGGEPMRLSGSFIGHALNFFPSEDDFVAIQGVHAMTEPGPYLLTLEGQVIGNEFSFSQLVLVEDGGYKSETLTVDSIYLDSEVDSAESAFIEGLVQEFTSEKLWAGIFVKPTPFDIFINSYFGTRRSYNGSEFKYFHSGIDFGGGEGADVICPADGIVVFSGPLEIRGNATLIDHGWGIYTGYWHQSEIFVQEGDVVTEGQVIGLVGNTGRSSGAHLHWEIWAGGVQVEPWDWLVGQFP